MNDAADDRRAIDLTKILDAPPALVFAAFTEADHLARWWGPEGFEVPAAESDPRPGGAVRIVMRGPDGHDAPLEGTFLEYDPPRRLVLATRAFAPDGAPILEGTTTVELADLGGSTELRLHAEARALVPDASPALAGMELGWISSLRALDDHLSGAADRQVVLFRMLEAPPQVVFDAWTDPAQLAQWWGPHGFTTTTTSIDVRPGGEWLFTMHGPDGTDYPNRIAYESIEPPSYLAMTHDAGPDGDDPSFRHTVTFDPWMGGTLLTMKAVWASAEERDRIVERSGAVEGGTQTLERLARHVVKSRHEA